MRSLSPRQQEAYEFIVNHIETHGHQPSIREMSERFEVAINAIVNSLCGLQRKGLIRMTGKSRAIRLVGVRFIRQPDLQRVGTNIHTESG